MRYRKNENLRLIVGCNHNAHHTAWDSTNCNVREESLLESLFFEFIRGNESTFCNAYRQDVIDINLGFYGHLENITGWEVSGKPSLSDHRHSVHSKGLRSSTPDQEP